MYESADRETGDGIISTKLFYQLIRLLLISYFSARWLKFMVGILGTISRRNAFQVPRKRLVSNETGSVRYSNYFSAPERDWMTESRIILRWVPNL